VKEGIGLRAFGQKDPLLEYKKEAFGMFKQLVEQINQETISMIWKAIPEMQANQEGQQLQQAQQQKAKVDMNRAKTEQADSTNMGYKSMGGQTNGSNGQNGQQRSDKKPEPVTVDEEPGRNDYVKIQKPGSGEVIDLKWKKAKRKVENEGWIVIEN